MDAIGFSAELSTGNQRKRIIILAKSELERLLWKQLLILT